MINSRHTFRVQDIDVAINENPEKFCGKIKVKSIGNEQYDDYMHSNALIMNAMMCKFV